MRQILGLCQCDVDCNEMGRFNKDDSDDSQSMEEACVDDKNLFTPLVIKNAMTEVLTTWEEIERQTYECYIDYITCDLDQYSPPLEECIQSDQMDEDVLIIDAMLPTTISEGGNRCNSYNYFAFFDTREGYEKLIRRNSVQRSHCQNQLYFY